MIAPSTTTPHAVGWPTSGPGANNKFAPWSPCDRAKHQMRADRRPMNRNRDSHAESPKTYKIRVKSFMLSKDFLHASPYHGTGGGDHGAPDPQQDGGALKQNTRAQARGMQTNRRE